MEKTGLKRKLNLKSNVSYPHIIKRHIKHLGGYLKYNTGKKFLNLCSMHAQMARGKETITGYPSTLQIEVNNICGLKCPGCPTGFDSNPDPKGQIKLENFKRVIDQVGEYIYWVELFGFGEPLLNKDICQMLDYAHARNIGTSISSNLNDLKEKDVERLVNSGLDLLVVSIDGLTQETYQKYRKGGNIEKVLHNLKLVLDTKDRLGRRYPLVEVHYIAMDHNRHEIPQTTEYMRKLDLNRFFFLLKEAGPSYMPVSDIGDEQEMIKNLRRYLKRCSKLWTHMFVCWNGEVRPCCLTFKNVGNIFENDFKQIYNNPLYTGSRRIFCGNGKNATGTDSPCLRCFIVKSRSAYKKVTVSEQ